jgi:hypothetical protein
MQHPRTHKIVKAVTAGLAAALLAVPAANARLAVDARHAALLNKDVAQQTVVRTDARHAALATKAGQNPLILQETRLSKIAQMHRHSGGINVPTAASVETPSSGFDWADAGIGAAAGLGLVVLAGAGVLVTRRMLVSV